MRQKENTGIKLGSGITAPLAARAMLRNHRYSDVRTKSGAETHAQPGCVPIGGRSAARARGNLHLTREQCGWAFANSVFMAT